MKINKKQLRTWIDALYSGEYSQTDGTLQDSRGYCCLGVACRVLIPDNKLYKVKDKNDEIIDKLNGGDPTDQPHAPKWLKEISDDFMKKTGVSLIDLNDEHYATFDEIATLLELVYIHNILKNNPEQEIDNLFLREEEEVYDESY